MDIHSFIYLFMEHIVYSHIFSHLTKYNILTEEQHGFRQFRSCETQLIATVHDLVENLNLGNQTDQCNPIRLYLGRYLMAASVTNLINLVSMDPCFPGLNAFWLTDINR